jgi:hypothetical protein
MSRFDMAKMVMFGLACTVVAACGGGGGSSPSANINVPTYKIQGSVRSGGAGVQGVTVTLGGLGAATAFTNSSGNYTFAGLRNGSYWLTAAKSGYSISPKAGTYTVNGSNLRADFSAKAISPIFYVIDDANQLAVLNIEAKTVTLIGNTGVFLNDIAFDENGTLFGTSGSALYRIDPATAGATLVGSMGIRDTTSLELGPDAYLYTASTGLYRVNPQTGVATMIGFGNGSYQSSGDLVFLGKDLYLTSLYQEGNDALIKLDPSTGKATLVGPTGYNAVYGLSTNDNVTLYGFTGAKVIKIDPTTGAGTLLWDAQGLSTLRNINGAAAR